MTRSYRDEFCHFCGVAGTQRFLVLSWDGDFWKCDDTDGCLMRTAENIRKERKKK